MNRPKFNKAISASEWRSTIPSELVHEQDPPWWKTPMEHIPYVDFKTDNNIITIDDISEEDKSQFETLYNKWKDETIIHSNGELIVNNDNFKDIINMGKTAVPLIINKLETDKMSYFLVHALDKICPDYFTYTGYVPLEYVVKTWITTYHLLANK